MGAKRNRWSTRKQSSLPAKDPPDLVLQCRQDLFHHGPGGIKVNAEVGMNKAITRSGDLPPRNSSFAGGQFSAEILDRFADDFELTDYALWVLRSDMKVLCPSAVKLAISSMALKTCRRKSRARSFIAVALRQVFVS